MEHCQKLPNRFAMILDPETIKGVIAHAEALSLTRRECHPLDGYRGRCANTTLAKYDAEVDAAPAADEDLDVIEAVLDAEDACAADSADCADDEF
jgi:hypothetical protein